MYYLLVDTSSLRAKTLIARSITEVTFSPICIAWTEKLTKKNKCPIKLYFKPTPPGKNLQKDDCTCSSRDWW